MIVGFRQDSHTFVNICNTGEFVVNCPSADDHLDDMMETARFFPEGVNELEQTGLTPIPSIHVKPPSIKECPQIAECTVDEIIRLEKSSGIVIANIKALVFDEELLDMPRERTDPGHEPAHRPRRREPARLFSRQVNYENVTMHELGEPPDAFKGGEVTARSMPWEDDALQTLMTIPPGVREDGDGTDGILRPRTGRRQGQPGRFQELAEEAGMSDDFFDRFRTKKAG